MTDSLRKKFIEAIAPGIAAIPAKLSAEEKEERQQQEYAKVLAKLAIEVQKDAIDADRHISITEAVRKVAAAAKSVDFAELSKQPAGTNHHSLTPSSFVGRVESYRNAARIAGETPSFAEAARKVLAHLDSSPNEVDFSFSDADDFHE